MIRFLTSIVVVMSLAGVATGNLFRPCDCGSDGVSMVDRPCHLTPTVSEDGDGCCDPGGGDEDGDGDGEGCTICCKPRPAFGEVGGEIALDAPGANGPATAGAEPDAADLLPRAVLALAPPRRPAFGPWLRTQEGLSVFLI